MTQLISFARYHSFQQKDFRYRLPTKKDGIIMLFIVNELDQVSVFVVSGSLSCYKCNSITRMIC